MIRIRLDQHLVNLGLAESRSKAKAAIEAGNVTVDGKVAKTASLKVLEDVEIAFEAAYRWVGRGALKLERAFELWPLDVAGKVALDVGASTGGFTEVCLDRGASKVFAVDVGQGQMHPRIADDDRVVNLEKTDARDLSLSLIPQSPDLIVCDASFISLLKVLPVPLWLANSGAQLMTLIKPQFEAENSSGVGKKGVVKDPAAHAAAITKVREWLESIGWAVQDVADSPIEGGDGNKEFLLWAIKQ